MKKIFHIFLIIFLILSLSACQDTKGDNIQSSHEKQLDKEGLAPYNLSEDEVFLLHSLGIDNKSQIIMFKAPKGVSSITANVYRLSDDYTWETEGGSGLAVINSTENNHDLSGIFTMLLKDDASLELRITTQDGAQYSNSTKEYENISAFTASYKSFLSEFQQIELNREIPVAIILYDNGTAVKSYTPMDYFNPSTFEDMDFVQAVTLTFSNEKA